MKYQGIAIIKDPEEGPCTILYGPQEKRDYDLDVKDGKLLDGRVIIGHQWLDKPTTDAKASSEFFNETVNGL